MSPSLGSPSPSPVRDHVLSVTLVIEVQLLYFINLSWIFSASTRAASKFPTGPQPSGCGHSWQLCLSDHSGVLSDMNDHIVMEMSDDEQQ